MAKIIHGVTILHNLTQSYSLSILQILAHQHACTKKLHSCPLAGFGCQLTDKVIHLESISTLYLLFVALQLNSTDMHTHLTENIFEHLSIIASQLKKAHRISDHDNISFADSGISSADSSLSIFDPKIDVTVQRDGGGAYRGRSDEGGANTYRGRHDVQQLMEVYRERYYPQALAKGAAQYPTRADIDKLQADMYTKDSQIASLKQQVAKLEKSFQSKSTKNEDSDFRLSLIENANYDGSMIWKIPQFSQRMEDARSGKYTSIFSLPFYSSRYGYKMCLRLYILGDGIGKSTHMSLFFVVMKGEFDAILPWPFTHKVSFRLINQHHGRDVVDVFQPDPMSSSFQRPKTDMNVASGCPRFISLAELNQGGFMEDNTIFIKVKVDTATMKHV